MFFKFIFNVSSSFAALVGSIVLQGIVPATTAITVVGVSPFNSLDLTTTQANLNIASITEQNNTALGYTVKLTSANSGLLKNGTLGQIAYTAKYNAVSVVLSTTPVTVTNQGPQLTPVNVNKSMSISYTGVPSASLMQGNYTDTLTFTIASN